MMMVVVVVVLVVVVMLVPGLNQGEVVVRGGRFTGQVRGEPFLQLVDLQHSNRDVRERGDQQQPPTSCIS